MSDSTDIEVRDKGGRGKGSKKRWLWTLLVGAVGVVGLLVLIGFSAMIIKWGFILLLVYGAFALGRRLLSKSSSAESSETALLPERDSETDALALLEQDRELDELKARMTDPSDKSK
jgi:hypothetical protein